jgi:hypothetical protein
VSTDPNSLKRVLGMSDEIRPSCIDSAFHRSQLVDVRLGGRQQLFEDARNHWERRRWSRRLKFALIVIYFLCHLAEILSLLDMDLYRGRIDAPLQGCKITFENKDLIY